MPVQSEQPFESIESAYEFFRLLSEAIAEAKGDIDAQLQGQLKGESGSQSSRRLDALRVVYYSVEKLEFHTNRSRRILNDLRSLRRLLFEERAASKEAVASQAAVTSQPVEGLMPEMPAAPVPAALHTPAAKVARVRAKAGRAVAA